LQRVTGKRALQLSAFCVLPVLHAAATAKDNRMTSGIYCSAGDYKGSTA